MAQIEFWFEFASTYSYLSAMRIEAVAASKGIAVAWKPFLLGPIFMAQGWTSSPFNLYPSKGSYMVRDISRIAAERGLAFQLPSPFPQNGLHAARLALAGFDAGWGQAFVRAVYDLQFAKGQNIAGADVLEAALESAGAPVSEALRLAATPEIKARLKANTEEAQAKGIFGAPSFIAGKNELFWGDDRLEQALDWKLTQF